MAVSPADILLVGDRLATLPDEASQRSAVGRHYYGAYHEVHSWAAVKLPVKGYDTVQGKPAGGMHQRFCTALLQPHGLCSKPEAAASKKIGMKLDAMRLRRKAADYDIGLPFLASEVAAQQQAAVSIIAYCASLP